MARQRFIWPTIWDDPDLGRLDSDARLLYIACFSLADDEGRLIGDPVHLRASVFKYQPVSDDDVRQIRDRIVASCGNYRVYNVRGSDYIAFKNWSDYQKPKYPKPSKLPPPPWLKTRRKPASESQTHSGNGSGNVPGSTPEAFGNDSSMGRDGLGSTPLPPKKKRNSRRKPTLACPKCGQTFDHHERYETHLEWSSCADQPTPTEGAAA